MNDQHFCCNECFSISESGILIKSTENFEILQCPEPQCHHRFIHCLDCDYSLHVARNSTIIKRGRQPEYVFLTHHWNRVHDNSAKKQKIEEQTVNDTKLSTTDDGNEQPNDNSTTDDGNKQPNDNVPSLNKDGDFDYNNSSFEYDNESEVIVDEGRREEAVDDDSALVIDGGEQLDDDASVASADWSIGGDSPSVTENCLDLEEMADNEATGPIEQQLNVLIAQDISYSINDNENEKEHSELNDSSNDRNDYYPEPLIPRDRQQSDEYYHRMEFLDCRSDDEKKLRKNSGAQSLSPVVLYFAQQKMLRDKNECLGGYRGLVLRAMMCDREHMYSVADEEESSVMLLYHLLLLRLSPEDQSLLLEYEKRKMKLFKLTDATMRRDVKITFPSTRSEIRRFITDGRYSIMKNFPVQRVFTIDNHACVSLRETILIMAAHHGGFEFAHDGSTNTNNRSGLNGSQAVQDLQVDVLTQLRKAGYREDQLNGINIGWIYFWSDSFLRCFVKQKDNSVWIFTVTVSPPYKEKSSGNYTFVLAMGKSSNDHTKVIEYFHKEARDLMSGFECYDRHKDETRTTAFGLLFHSADRPERQALSKTRQEGDYGRTTNWAVDVSDEYFPACEECYCVITKAALRNGKLSTEQCNRCLCWTMKEEHSSIDHSHSKMYPPAPENYPTTFIPNEKVVIGREPCRFRIGPIHLSVQFMICACRYAYLALRGGHWTTKNVEQYLRTCNVRQSQIKIVIEQAVADKKNKTHSDPDVYCPLIWFYEDIFARNRVPDLPMHAVAHGMIPDLLDAYSQILAHWKRLTEFHNYANEVMSTIAAFGLDWCKVKTLPKAAWIAENVMAFARLMVYLFGMYFLNGKFNKEVDPMLFDMRRLLNSFQALLSVLMSREPNVDRVDTLLKLLLSATHYMQKGYGGFKSKSTSRKKGKKAMVSSSTVKQVDGEKVVDQLNLEELGAIRCRLDMNTTEDGKTTIKSLKDELQSITVTVLKQHLSEYGINDQATKSLRKEQLQRKLFESILEREISSKTSSNPTSNDTDGKFNWLWNKGAWLSLNANYKKQIEYLGSILLIW